MAVRLCFVCLGNICRSPTAEGVMRALVARAGLDDAVHIESAGTGAWHAGEALDARSAQAAAQRGFPLEGSARRFDRVDFGRFDYVLAMDRENRDDLEALAPSDDARAKIALLRSFDATAPPDAEVPDPYYGGERGFDEVVDICEAACSGLLDHLVREHTLSQ